MHANPTNPRKKVWREKFVRSGFFFFAVFLHLAVLLLIATLVIWPAQRPPPADEFNVVNVKTSPPPAPVQPSSSGAQAYNPQFEPETVTVPVVAPSSMITTPANSDFKVDASKIMNQELSKVADQMPKGTGLNAAGGGDSLSGLGNGYGTGTESADEFVGNFYDLKQTPDRKPTDVAEDKSESSGPENQVEKRFLSSPATQNGLKVLRSFIKKWDMRILNGYFKAPGALYTPQICIPVTPSQNATDAYHVHDIVRARRWIVIYEAKITPPESGKFRFIGFGDDFLVVRVDGDNVLDGSLPGEELDLTANVDEDVGIGPERRPLKCGKWIEMEAGTSVDMQVLIGEGPGGESGFLLMVQKEDDDSPKGDYPVLQLQDVAVPNWSSDYTFSKKKMLFQVSH
ncbi:MAG: hypothetical protein LV481_14030 [Methylacidiphilales bacterium]|nr:hypothetical protein [Candidatus Methylacidiphilales bacterium]